MSRQSHFLLFIFIFTGFLSLPSAGARREVESAERLQFLNQATGSGSSSSSSSTSSFQNRLNAILDTSASTQRTYVAKEDARIRENIAAEKLEEELIAEEEASKEASDEDGPLKAKDQAKIEDTVTQKKVDGSDTHYLKTRAEIQKEFDERIKKKDAPGPIETAASGSKAPESRLPLSLANNPFYFGNSESSENPLKNFENRKPIIVSRMIQHGFSREDSETVVAQSTSPEELILLLLREFSLSYGEAAEMTGE